MRKLILVYRGTRCGEGFFILKCFKSKKEGREDHIKSIFKALKGNSEKFIE